MCPPRERRDGQPHASVLYSPLFLMAIFNVDVVFHIYAVLKRRKFDDNNDGWMIVEL